jgi:hypothetical protein
VALINDLMDNFDPEISRISDIMYTGNEEDLTKLLRERPDLATGVVVKHSQLRLIHMAGHAAIVRILLGAGADVDALDAFGCSPLLRCQSPEALLVLLEHGADARRLDQNGRGAISAALSEPWHRSFRVRIATALIRILIASGVKPDEHDLSVAVRYNFAVLARLLLKHGADPLAPAYLGLNAYQAAYSHPKMQSLLRTLVPGIGPKSAALGRLRAARCYRGDDSGIVLEYPNVVAHWHGSQNPTIGTRTVFDGPPIRRAAFSADGSHLIVASGNIESRRMPDLSLVRSIDFMYSAEAIACSPRYPIVAVTGYETLFLYDIENGSLLCKAELGEENSSLSFSSDGSRLAAGSCTQGCASVFIFDVLIDGTQLTNGWTIDRYGLLGSDSLNSIFGVTFSPTHPDRILFFETDGRWQTPEKPGWFGRVVMYDLNSNRELWRLVIDKEITQQTAVAPFGYYTEPAFSRDGRFVGLAVQDLFLQMSAETGAVMQSLVVPGPANSVVSSACGNYWIITLQDRLVSVLVC